MEKELTTRDIFSTTIVSHGKRKLLGLSMTEYCLADMIMCLSKASYHESSIDWCTKSKKEMGEYIGITQQGVHNCLNSLLKKGIIIRDPQTKFLKVTKKWL